ncbi:RNA polymerase factor sigma-54 [soil metagenome]
MEQHIGMQSEQRAQVLPRLIEANYLLQLSSQSLDAVITAELSSNPALELTDPVTCQRCGTELEGDICPSCRDERLDQFATDSALERDSESFHEQRFESDLEVDQFSYIAEAPNLADEVRADAFATLPTSDHSIASFIVDAIDERGWLALPVEEIAAMTKRDAGDIERVLQTIQHIAPPGVGARNLAECLKLQIDDLRQQGLAAPEMVERLCEADFADLGAHRYQRLAKKLGTTPEAIAEAHEFIRCQLTPNPLQGRSATPWRHTDQTQTATPDVIVRIVDDEILVALAGRTDSRLSISDDYVYLSKSSPNRSSSTLNGAAPDIEGMTESEREHVRASVRLARDFMSKLEQRRRTLLKIATVVCERQVDFLRGSVRELRPLTRSEVAAQIGVNESTVSRATAEKYVMLPNRRVVPFSDFFTASLNVKDVIKEIIANEAKAGRTLSDQRICEMLEDQGYRIARRTVTKYRLQLDILPSTQRHAGNRSS